MYLDTSVVVKLYVPEPDSGDCERVVAGRRIVSSELLYAELWSALLAKEHIKSQEVVAFPELGMEAVWKITVENFPAFILVDDKGNDFFTQINQCPTCS